MKKKKFNQKYDIELIKKKTTSVLYHIYKY